MGTAINGLHIQTSITGMTEKRENNMDIISQIDLKKHVLYSPLMEKVIKKHLEAKYQGEELEKMWEKVSQHINVMIMYKPF